MNVIHTTNINQSVTNMVLVLYNPICKSICVGSIEEEYIRWYPNSTHQRRESGDYIRCPDLDRTFFNIGVSILKKAGHTRISTSAFCVWAFLGKGSGNLNIL